MNDTNDRLLIGMALMMVHGCPNCHGTQIDPEAKKDSTWATCGLCKALIDVLEARPAS